MIIVGISIDITTIENETTLCEQSKKIIQLRQLQIHLPGTKKTIICLKYKQNFDITKIHGKTTRGAILQRTVNQFLS